MIQAATLFSGIGGPDIASEAVGWNNAFHCEINPFGQRILKYFFPNAISYSDITKTDFSIWRGRIDVLTGGFPCQGFSLAGERLGTDDDRYLWPSMLRAINEIKPPWVIGENVTGIVSMEDKSGVWKEVFPKVESRKIVRYDTVDYYEAVYTRQAKMLVATIVQNLEEAGYEVQLFAIPAAAVGAPHKRERIWFVAHAKNPVYSRCLHSQPKQKGANVWQFGNLGSGGGKWLYSQAWHAANANNNRTQGSKTIGHQGAKPFNSRNIKYDANANMPGCQQGNQTLERGKAEQPNGLRIQQNATNGNGKRLQGKPNKGRISQSAAKPYQQPSRLLCSKWENFPTQSPVCSGNDGFPGVLDGITLSKWRTESIKGFGNAIVPQVIVEFYKVIDQIIRENQLIS